MIKEYCFEKFLSCGVVNKGRDNFAAEFGTARLLSKLVEMVSTRLIVCQMTRRFRPVGSKKSTDPKSLRRIQSQFVLPGMDWELST